MKERKGRFVLDASRFEKTRKQFKARKRSCFVERKTAQSSIEFLYSVGAVLLVFSISAVLFYQSQQDAAAIESYMDSRLACQEVAGKISAVSSGGDGTVSYMQFPLVAGALNYTVRVSGDNRTVSVSHKSSLVGCRFGNANVSNGTSASFNVASGAAVRNIDGGVLVG